MTKHKMKTASAMGMLKLYSIGTTKIYKRENAYFIRAGSRDEAQRVWDRYKEQHFIDPLTPLPDGVIYKYNEYRDCKYDYDYDNTLETVDENKFDKESRWHREALDELYKDQKQRSDDD
jgi:hypothetical protein